MNTSKNILIAEDDAGIAEVTQIILEQMGHSVVIVRSRRGLMQVVRSREFAMILLDISIIDGNGAEIATELKRDPFTAHIPIFLMSANNLLEKLAREAGVEGYIEKPFSIDRLEQVVTKTIK